MNLFPSCFSVSGVNQKNEEKIFTNSFYNFFKNVQLLNDFLVMRELLQTLF